MSSLKQNGIGMLTYIEGMTTVNVDMYLVEVDPSQQIYTCIRKVIIMRIILEEKLMKNPPHALLLKQFNTLKFYLTKLMYYNFSYFDEAFSFIHRPILLVQRSQRAMNTHLLQSITQTCPIHTADREQLIHICLDPQCKSQPLLCHQCILQDHKGHQNISIGKFAVNIDNLFYDQSVLDKSNQLKIKIQKASKECLNNIKKHREDISNYLTNLEAITQKHFASSETALTNLLKKQTQIGLKPFEIKKDIPFDSMIKEVLEQRANYYQKIHARKQMKVLFDELSMDLQSSVRTITSKMLYIPTLDIFQRKQYITKPYPVENVCWSQTNKHSDLVVNSTYLTRKLFTTSKSGRFNAVCGLINYKMKDTDSKPYSLKLQIKSNTGFIVGMCNPQAVAAHKYTNWNWERLGHGHFCFSLQSLSFSDSVEKVNNNLANSALFSTPFQTIELRYDPVKGKLKCARNYSDGMEMDIQQKKGKTYVFCIYLYDIKDELEIRQA